MSIDAAEYARLSDDSYNDRSTERASGDPITLKGSNIQYTVLDVANDPKSDYQGTAYRRVDTGEVIIAHRGTESAKDGMADAGMVLNGRNSQLDEAMKFTAQAMAIAQKVAGKDSPLSVSITGHSLGGTLAQITAAKHGVHAETFNAYGPRHLTDLGRYGVDVHAPHPNIVNHVRATDVVSAGGPHLGQMKIYAAAQDIESLRHGRYIGGSPLPGNPLLAADISAHTIKNFLPGNKWGESVMNPANEARARAYAGPIAQYRHDVMKGRIDLHKLTNNAMPMASTVNGVRLGAQVVDAATTVVAGQATQAIASGAQAAGQAYGAVRDSVGTGARRAAEALERTGDTLREGASRAIERRVRPGPWLSSQAEPAPLLLDDGQHPGNGFYQQALAGLEKINAERGISSDLRTCNAAGSLASAACQARFRQIDLVAVSDSGDKLIAVQGMPAAVYSKVTYVETTVALNTSLAESSQAFAVAEAQNQQQNRERSQQAAQPAQAAPSLA
jgi:hypothetical protein